MDATAKLRGQLRSSFLGKDLVLGLDLFDGVSELCRIILDNHVAHVRNKTSDHRDLIARVFREEGLCEAQSNSFIDAFGGLLNLCRVGSALAWMHLRGMTSKLLFCHKQLETDITGVFHLCVGNLEGFNFDIFYR